MSFITTVKRMLPKSTLEFVRPYYHYALAIGAVIFYRFPSRRMNVILVTGTKGKTTTTEILYSIFSKAGHRVALLNGLRFKTPSSEVANKTKLTTPGRGFVQSFLRKALNDECSYAILEMTSEGAVLFRHKFTFPNALIVNTITPEHIESHGSFNNYVKAKLLIRDELVESSKKDKKLVLNKDDELHKYFSVYDPNILPILYSVEKQSNSDPNKKISFNVAGVEYFSSLRGTGNLENLIASVTLATAYDIPSIVIQEVISNIKFIPGRLEEIENELGLTIVVDYAHTPESMQQAFEVYKSKRLVCVFGSAGGGRDRQKRKLLGKVASDYCELTVLTEDEPYDEDPKSIAEEIAEGMKVTSKREIVVDRKQAISFALDYAKKKRKGSMVVLVLGMGVAPFLCRGNKKIPWSDKETILKELKKYDGKK